MANHERWMHRCLELAGLGAGSAAPNPMVGAVLVQEDRILSEGWHRSPGAPHAEASCLFAFGDQPIPEDAVLYVNLEPCAHHGRTPPCADLLIRRGVKRVVIAHRDPFPSVNGSGVARLRAAGIEVIEGVSEAESRWHNRRFLTSVQLGRPYVVLKWARSSDGFIDRFPREGRVVQRISGPATNVLVHRWRSEEQAILVGSRTVLHDDPRLDVRHVQGRSPLRVVLDRGGIAPSASHVFDGTIPTLLFSTNKREDVYAEQYLLNLSDDPITVLLTALQQREIRSVLVEGGAELLAQLIQRGMWDEARVITSHVRFGDGTPAPLITAAPCRTLTSDEDRINLFVNTAQQPEPLDAWPW